MAEQGKSPRTLQAGYVGVVIKSEWRPLREATLLSYLQLEDKVVNTRRLCAVPKQVGKRHAIAKGEKKGANPNRPYGCHMALLLGGKPDVIEVDTKCMILETCLYTHVTISHVPSPRDGMGLRHATSHEVANLCRLSWQAQFSGFVAHWTSSCGAPFSVSFKVVVASLCRVSERKYS